MKRKVYVTGIGFMMGRKKDNDRHCVVIEKEQYENLIPNLSYKSADRISKISMATVKMALDNAGINYSKNMDECGLFLGTMYGPLNSIHGFDSVSVNKGALYVNPRLFPNTVLNSPACQTSIQYGIAGPVYTIYNGITSALDAVGLGYLHVVNNLCPVALTGGVDEVPDIQLDMHKPNKLIVESSGFLVLENEPKDYLKKHIEIVEYDTFIVYHSEYNKICFEVSNRISEILKRKDMKQIDSRELYIYSSLSKNCVEQISKRICTYSNISFKVINSSDYMSLGSLFNIFCINNEHTNCWFYYDDFEHKGLLKKIISNILCVMLSIDENKVSMLVLKVKPLYL